MTVTMYDVTKDETREVTQQDVDLLQAVSQAYGKLRQAAAQAHIELLAEIDRVKLRGQPVVEVPDIQEMQAADGAVERAREALAGTGEQPE